MGGWEGCRGQEAGTGGRGAGDRVYVLWCSWRVLRQDVACSSIVALGSMPRKNW